MPSAAIRLGIDFGTSNTVAVLRWPDGRARTLLFDGNPLLPSAVYAEPDGAILVGRDAIHSARLEPSRFEPNPKRCIDQGSVLLGDREVAVGEMMSAVLGRVDEERRRTVGDAVVDVTITCPASWGATRRLVLADAATAAGLGTVRLVAEPVAAATYFTQVLGRDVPIGSAVVVHDFGAGTFDASVVTRTSTGFDVLAVDGRDDVGGLDIDEAVVKRLGVTCAERDPAAWQRLEHPSTVEERRARRLLWDDARVAKERLSRHPTADVTVPLLDIEVHITREELEELARPLLEQTVRVTQGVMRWAKLAEGRLAGVFLVGGSSRIPLVATLLHRAIGEAPVAIEQPELVVAEGSVLAGAVLAVSEAAAPGPATGAPPPVWPSPVSPAAASGVPVSPVHPVSPSPVSPSPVSPAAASGVPVSPVSGAPVSGSPVSGAPVSGTPVSGSPVSGSPVSGSPGPSYAVGRVSVPGAAPPGRAKAAQPVALTRQMAPVRPVQPLSPARPHSPARVGAPGYPATYPPAFPAYPPSQSAGADLGYRSGRRPAYRRRHPVARAFRTLLLILLLAAVPVISAYIAYKITVGEPLWPLGIASLPWPSAGG